MSVYNKAKEHKVYIMILLYKSKSMVLITLVELLHDNHIEHNKIHRKYRKYGYKSVGSIGKIGPDRFDGLADFFVFSH